MLARSSSVCAAALALAMACIPHDDPAQRGRSVAPQQSPTRALESPPRRADADAPSAKPSEDACAALSDCCDVLDEHARPYCLAHVEEGDALACALSYHWSACTDRELPDVAAGPACFRTSSSGCHDSLISACRAAGCATERGVHGCLVSGDDRRDVLCGNW